MVNATPGGGRRLVVGTTRDVALGPKLALGEFRAVARRCMSSHKLREIEEAAESLYASDTDSLLAHVNPL